MTKKQKTKLPKVCNEPGNYQWIWHQNKTWKSKIKFHKLRIIYELNPMKHYIIVGTYIIMKSFLTNYLWHPLFSFPGKYTGKVHVHTAKYKWKYVMQ